VWDSPESCCSLCDVLGQENTPHTHTHIHTQHGLCNFLPPMHFLPSSAPPATTTTKPEKNPDLTPIPEPPKHRWVEKLSEKSCQVFMVGQTLLNAN